jgi:hypothetical protein
MKNNLFNKSQMKKYANNKAFHLTVPKHDFLKTHAEKIKNGDFKSEKSSYLYFYDFLKEILGYDREENILFENKEAIGRGKVEFVLKSADEHKFMVIELKDQTADLDKPQNRANDKRSPVDQAFSYAQHSDINNPIDWIMVSNFKEFRLYNYNERSGKYICFTYEDLLDKETFQSFMVSFSKKSHTEKDYPEKLLKATLVVEKQLEHNFYKLFHETRLMLIKELEELNDLTREESVHYAQLILNRYMFIAFAEDTGLLTSQISTDTIITPIKKGNLRHRSIWQRVNELFLDINEGNDYKKISGYNGGLFAEDLDFLKIRDTVEDQGIFEEAWQEWNFNEYEKDIKHLLGSHADVVNPIYKNLLTISSFDFSSELDVNILGHIFENSIGDLEELKEDTKGRRKKDGIFYTPEYITDYICRNTIIPYLSKSGDVNTVDDLIGEYWGSAIEELDQKVKNIKIVDPACGSGAFLNKAADVLIEIHLAIHAVLYKDLKETLIPYFDHVGKRREILLNNIHGVDLNEESVDITKLSLFLKVCKKDKKLPDLDKNIKCGNSLIDDPKYTNKPFDWEEQFPRIFEEGGFDVVIGNPPYVRQEKIKEIKPYLNENYIVFTGQSDLYVYFFEKAFNLLNINGLLGYISSNKFIKANYGKKLRKFILDNLSFDKYVDHTFDSVFEDATAYPSVFILRKSIPNSDNQIIVNNDFKINQSRFDEGAWGFETPKILDLKDKINQNGTIIKDLPGVNIQRGIITGYNKAFIIDENQKNSLINDDKSNIDLISPLVRGKDIFKNQISWKGFYIILSKHGFHEEVKNYPIILEYLKNHEKALRNRGQVKNGQHHWLELDNKPTDNYLNLFKNPKLLYPGISSKLFAVYDDQGYYTNDKCYLIISEFIDLKYLSALISSKTLNFFFKFLGTPLQGNSYMLSKIFVEKLPIYPATPKEQQPFIIKADQMLQLNRQLQDEVEGFHNWLKNTFKIEKLSQKLEKYYELTFNEFLDEVKKKKIDVRSRENQELLREEYQKSLDIINPLINGIEQTDKEIDVLVYELYGLTDEEIKIIEDSLD